MSCLSWVGTSLPAVSAGSGVAATSVGGEIFCGGAAETGAEPDVEAAETTVESADAVDEFAGFFIPAIVSSSCHQVNPPLQTH